MNNNVRTRFSPSPTGMIHLGNGRAALYSALYAKQHQGVFILRIEDTDAARSEERHVESLQEDLHWMGIFWQEGPVVGGDYGPYWQSQRQANYATYYRLLEEQKRIYPCFCTDQELMLARKLQLSRSLAPRYSGTCRKLSAQEIEKRIAEGKKPAWRFMVPANTTIEFEDIVKGPQSFNSNDIGDFIVRRADGTAPFLFCNAIDDAMMKVSHVLRGEDHLANTPRQLLLLRTLGLSTPLYGHLSLIVGADGAPLSKRHGSFSLDEMRKQGYLPIAVMNYLVRLGHTCESADLLDFDQLAPYFKLEKLSRSSARFDQAQLHYWQKIAVQKLDLPILWQWLGDEVVKQVPESQRQLFAETIKANVEFPHDALIWSEIFFGDNFDSLSMNEENLRIINDAGEEFFAIAEQAVAEHGITLAVVLNMIKEKLGINGKKLFMPLRVALTGKTHGPELAQMAALLGQEKIQQRLKRASTLVGETVKSHTR